MHFVHPELYISATLACLVVQAFIGAANACSEVSITSRTRISFREVEPLSSNLISLAISITLRTITIQASSGLLSATTAVSWFPPSFQSFLSLFLSPLGFLGVPHWTTLCPLPPQLKQVIFGISLSLPPQSPPPCPFPCPQPLPPCPLP